MDTLLSYLSALAAQQVELHTLPVSLLPPRLAGSFDHEGGDSRDLVWMVLRELDGSIVDVYTHVLNTLMLPVMLPERGNKHISSPC